MNFSYTHINKSAKIVSKSIVILIDNEVFSRNLILYKRGIRSIMNELTKLFQSKWIKRVIIFVLIALILYSLRSMMDFILLTFIFIFLMNRLVCLVTQKFRFNWK